MQTSKLKFDPLGRMSVPTPPTPFFSEVEGDTYLVLEHAERIKLYILERRGSSSSFFWRYCCDLNPPQRSEYHRRRITDQARIDKLSLPPVGSALFL